MIVLFCGCQSIPAPLDPTSFAFVADSSANSAVSEESIRQRLQFEFWQQDYEWSPLDERPGVSEDSEPVNRFRWRPSVPAVFAASEDAAETEPADVGKFDPLSYLDDTESVNRQELLVVLKRLSHEKSLVGLNASILLARVVPRNSPHVIPLLSEVARKGTFRSVNSDDLVASESSEQTQSHELRLALLKTFEPATVRCKQATHAAVIEAWCWALRERTAARYRALEEPGRLLERWGANHPMSGELMLALARDVPPRRMPTLESQLLRYTKRAASWEDSVGEGKDDGEAATLAVDNQRKKPPSSAEMRSVMLASLRYAVWSEGTDQQNEKQQGADTKDYPEALWDLAWDQDTEIRQAFGAWAVIRHHPKAFSVLQNQLSDVDPKVRVNAVELLSELRTEEARDKLRELAGVNEEVFRSHVVRALGHWGPEEVQAYRHDESRRVRRAFVESMAEWPSSEAAMTLLSFIGDRDPNLQHATLIAIQEWPDELANPILAEAYAEGGFQTRREASRQLFVRAGLRLVKLEASAEERRRELRQQSAERDISLGSWKLMERFAFDTGDESNEQRRTEILAALNALESDEHDGVIRWEPKMSDLTICEEWARTCSPTARRKLLGEVLPNTLPLFEHLRDLDSSDVFVRRKAAQNISNYGREQSLPPLLLEELSVSLNREQDQLVWKSIMSSIMRDKSVAGTEVARLALNSGWPDVRVLGCRYAGRHRVAAVAAELQLLFDDQNHQVRLEAIRAAGHSGHPRFKSRSPNADSVDLQSLMMSSDATLRKEATIALARLGDATALETLGRLVRQGGVQERCEVVRTMAEVNHPSLIRGLIELGWTERSDLVKVEVLRALDKMVREEQKPITLNNQQSIQDRIDLWVRHIDQFPR